MSTSNPIKPTVVYKVWGFEETYINNDYCVKMLYVLPRMQSSVHKHKSKDETFFVVKGLLRLWVGEPLRLVTLKEGDVYHLPPNTWHRFDNPSSEDTVVFLEASTHDDPNDTVRKEGSRRMDPAGDPLVDPGVNP